VARKRALIVKFGQIGDVIMTIPAASALHDRGFEIDWLCGKAARPLLECYSWIRVIPVDDQTIFCGGPLERAWAIARLWATVLPSRYDICATLYYDRRFRLLTWPIRARRRITLSRKSRATTLLSGRHHTDEFVRILLQEGDGLKEGSTGPVRPDRLHDVELLPAHSSKRVAMVPGGTKNVLGEQSLRRWPKLRFES
jgi:heptosyltransferase II